MIPSLQHVFLEKNDLYNMENIKREQPYLRDAKKTAEHYNKIEGTKNETVDQEKILNLKKFLKTKF